MTDTKISAIVPCFNNKEELLMTLLSIEHVKDTYFNIEIVIVDGSKEQLIEQDEINACIDRLNNKDIN